MARNVKHLPMPPYMHITLNFDSRPFLFGKERKKVCLIIVKDQSHKAQKKASYEKTFSKKPTDKQQQQLKPAPAATQSKA